MVKTINNNFTLVLAGCIGAFLISCGGEGDDADEAFRYDPMSDQFKTDAINIATVAVISSTLDAELLAIKKINEAGGILGKELNLVGMIADNTEAAVRQAEEMLEYDIKVISVSFSSRSRAVSELSIPKQVPLISESTTRRN